MSQLSRIRFYHRLVSIYRSASSYEHHQYTYLFHSVKLFAQRRSAPGRCEMALPANELHCVVAKFLFRARASKKPLAGKVNWACRVVFGGPTFLWRILDQTREDMLNSFIPPAGKMQGFMKISDGGIPAVVISMESASISASLPQLMSIRMHVQ